VRRTLLLVLVSVALSTAARAQDGVYRTVAPCRLLDTRVASAGSAWRGPLAAGSQTLVDHDRNLVQQGGNANGCGVAAEATAIAATVTVVAPAGMGDLRLFAAGSPVPLASTINFAVVPGLALANTTIVPVARNGGADFAILVDGAAVHVVVDVVGYFVQAERAAWAQVTRLGVLVAERTRGFTAVSNPAPGLFCLTPEAGVSIASAVPAVTLDGSTVNNVFYVAQWLSLGGGCAAGTLAVRTVNVFGSPENAGFGVQLRWADR
jgi:hypothetical protein